MQAALRLGLPGGAMSSPGSGSQGKLGSSPTQSQPVWACWGALLAGRDHMGDRERKSVSEAWREKFPGSWI